MNGLNFSRILNFLTRKLIVCIIWIFLCTFYIHIFWVLRWRWNMWEYFYCIYWFTDSMNFKWKHFYLLVACFVVLFLPLLIHFHAFCYPVLYVFCLFHSATLRFFFYFLYIFRVNTLHFLRRTIIIFYHFHSFFLVFKKT